MKPGTANLAIATFAILLSAGRVADANTTIYDLVFMHHNSTSLTNSEADRIAEAATLVLRTDSGADDLSCDVVVRRRGDVGRFFETDGVIDNANEFAQVEQVPGNIKNRTRDKLVREHRCRHPWLRQRPGHFACDGALRQSPRRNPPSA